MTNEFITELQYASPIIITAAMSIILIVIDAISGKNKTVNYVLSILSLTAALIASGALLLSRNFQVAQTLQEYPLTMGMLSYSGFAYIFDFIFLAAGLLTIIASREYNSRAEYEYKEFYSLTVLAVLGMMMIAHSNDMLLLFIGIEVMSISFFVLAGYFRNKITSIEAALKYFLLGVFATGFLLYGIAMIYGATGSINFNIIQQTISLGNYDKLYLLLGVGLAVIGLSFKIAAFPFHQWAPDVYQGSPTISAGFMSTAGKAAAIFAFILIGKYTLVAPIDAIASSHIGNIQLVIAVLSAATMLIGNITAISQNNVKRMLAYSSVAHAGYMLMGIVANSTDGWAGSAYYAAAYMLMQIGAFAIVANLEGKDGEYLSFEHYAGLYKSRPLLAALMALFLLSLAGIPPFAGFFGKYYIFKSAIDAGYLWLAIVGVISSVISVYFYLRLIVFMYFKEAGEYSSTEELPKAAGFTLLFTAAFVVLIGVFPNYLIDLARLFA